MMGQSWSQDELDSIEMAHAKLRLGGDPDKSLQVRWPNEATPTASGSPPEARGDKRQHSIRVTPLQYAVLQSNTQLTQLLLQKGADPNKGSDDLPPPLHCAADFGNMGLAVALVQGGANPYQQSSTRSTSANRIMRRARPGDAPVHIACRIPPSSSTFGSGLEGSMTQMLQPMLNGASTAATSASVLDAKGRNFLYIATSNNLSGLCRWILDQSVGAQLMNTGEKAPIFAAIERRSEELVGLLLYRGASLTVTYKNHTPMQHAVLHSNFMFYNRHKIVALLAAAGADVNTLPPDWQGSAEGRTLLGVCTSWGWKKVTAALAEAGASTEPPQQTWEDHQQQQQRQQQQSWQQQQQGSASGSSSTALSTPATTHSRRSASDTAAATDAGGDCGGGDTRGQCAVCLDAVATIGITHKGDNVVHCCLCAECAEELKKSGQLSKCVYCRKPVQQLMQIVHT